jgi:hypothetical protein
MNTCAYCGHTGEDVHEYPDRGKNVMSCDNVTECGKREVENFKKKAMEGK